MFDLVGDGGMEGKVGSDSDAAGSGGGGSGSGGDGDGDGDGGSGKGDGGSGGGGGGPAAGAMSLIIAHQYYAPVMIDGAEAVNYESLRGALCSGDTVRCVGVIGRTSHGHAAVFAWEIFLVRERLPPDTVFTVDLTAGVTQEEKA